MSHALPDWLTPPPATAVPSITDHQTPDTSRPATRRDAIAAMTGPLLHFLPPHQARFVTILLSGEDGQFYRDKMVELARIVEAMPESYQTHDTPDPIAHLRYFSTRGFASWHLIEKDRGDDNDQSTKGQQHQAFGLRHIHEAELGYVSLPELFESGLVEMDFHFTPKPLSKIWKR